MSDWGETDIEAHVQDLSFAATAAYAMAFSLTVQWQCEDVAIIAIRRGLGLSKEAWTDVYGELFEAGLLFETAEEAHVSMTCAGALLSRAIGAPGRPKASEWAHLRQLALECHGEECVYCGAPDDLAIDHVLALELGGSNHPANLVPACKSCNSAKGARSWRDWWPRSHYGRKFAAEQAAKAQSG